MVRDRRLCVALWVLAAACAEPSPDDPESAAPESPWPLERACVAPAGMGSPSTIAAVVDLVNALPKPTGLPCLLESLDRPLAIYASTSTAGAQPATGPHSPRIFLFRGDLVMSVVPEGLAAPTLELSYAVGGRRSVKAELVFPVDETLEPSAPYDAVEFGRGTTCGLCHGAETRVPSADVMNVWASDMFQDEPDQALPRSFLRQSALDCDHEAEPERCAMLDAIFGHGELERGDLSRDSLICRPIR